MSAKRLSLVLALLIVGGCAFPIREAVDHAVCSKLDLPVDLPAREPEKKLPPKKAPDAKGLEKRIEDANKLPDVLEVEVPPLKGLPEKPESLRQKILEEQFPPLPRVPEEITGIIDPMAGRPLTLADLQKLALANNPGFRQIVADLKAAQGNALQTRLYPNPIVGFYGQSMGPGGGPINGGYYNHVVKTPGKIRLAYEAANNDVQVAELRVRQAEADLRTAVRQGYFDVLVARENLKLTRAMVRLTDEVYEVLKLQVKQPAAAYEAKQVSVIAWQTRAMHIQAHHTYQQKWQQLAATLGLPGMKLTELAGRLDMGIPKYDHEKVLAQVLSTHTDVLIARVGITKAANVLRLAQVTAIPDVNYNITIAEDNSPGPGPFRVIAMGTVGVALPIWDRNQGGIQQAQGWQVRALAEENRVRADLSARLADAFSRYRFNREIVDIYRKDMLISQIQAFRAVVKRHAGGDVGGVSFNDLIVAEQTLVGLIQNYMGSLHDMWFAVIDVAALLQTPDLFQVDETWPPCPIPDLDQLFSLRFLAPCSQVTDPQLLQADGAWTLYAPAPAKTPKTEQGPAPRPVPQKQTKVELGAPSPTLPPNNLPMPAQEGVQPIPVISPPSRLREVLFVPNQP
jgi:cobalt-zinc-cadmium efflux system outer membrane protein